MWRVSLWGQQNLLHTYSSGFTAVPGGFRSAGGTFYGIDQSAAFWTSKAKEGTVNAWYRTLNFDREQVYRQYNDMRLGLSVRCVKDL